MGKSVSVSSSYSNVIEVESVLVWSKSSKIGKTSWGRAGPSSALAGALANLRCYWPLWTLFGSGDVFKNFYESSSTKQTFSPKVSFNFIWNWTFKNGVRLVFFYTWARICACDCAYGFPCATLKYLVYQVTVFPSLNLECRALVPVTITFITIIWGQAFST